MSKSILPGERHHLILQRLAVHGRIVAAEIAREFGTSEDTIRRDLRELAEAGKCTRVYGGALPLSPASGSLRERERAAPERKAALARCAASLVQRGQVIFLDAGSTNTAIAHALPDGLGVTVITNAPGIAAALGEQDGIEVIMVGGLLDRRSGGVVGARAVADIGRMRADLCFVGACAVSARMGIGAFGAEEAEVKRAMVAAAEHVIVAATAEKLATRAPYIVASAADLGTLIVEPGCDRAELAALAANGTRILVADA